MIRRLRFIACLFALATTSTRAEIVVNTNKTFSMGNVFPPGAQAALIVVPFGSALRGYVVRVRRVWEVTYTCHRCIGEGIAANGRKWILTKGDANMFADFPRWAESEFFGVLDLPQKALALSARAGP